jgi:ABC-type antimicrobial peptide transport system ATPase subunit
MGVASPTTEEGVIKSVDRTEICVASGGRRSFVRASLGSSGQDVSRLASLHGIVAHGWRMAVIDWRFNVWSLTRRYL